MDANGQRLFQLAEVDDFAVGAGARYDRAQRKLRLSSQRRLELQEDAAAALALTSEVPCAADGYGSVAVYDPAGPRIHGEGPASGSIDVLSLPGPATDLAVGHDGVLYVAVQGAVLLHDLRSRWVDVTLSLPGFSALRLAAAANGVFVLDRAGAGLALLRGLPLPNSVGPAAPGVFRPDPENSRPPTLRRVPFDFGSSEPIAIAESAAGQIGVLCFTAQGCELRRLLQGEQASTWPIEGVTRPYSLAWLDEERFALRVTGSDEAIVCAPDADGVARAVGDFYPLPGAVPGPFAHRLAGPPLFPTAARPRPLHRLSLPALARSATVTGSAPFDSGVTAFVWHRLYLEASLPPGAALTVWLAATEDQAPPPSDGWSPHAFGEANEAGAPHGAWVPAASELPFHAGLLGCPLAAGRTGLFTALIARRGRRVSHLAGRFLHVRLVLEGSGRSGPELAALRVYGPRFSYAQRYLPELYREHVLPPDSDALAPPTPADFLERFLANFEGVLTPLEDRIGNAHLLTDPDTAPSDSLDWLASWIGLALDPALPPARRREMIARGSELARCRGTLRGLSLALEVSSGGAVSRGEIIILEEFRLRRTFATILGADLADEDDPLTGGLSVSGNSFVGDTLILGNEERREFLALFDAELPKARSDAAAVAAFFERLAHRVSVLVQREQGPELLALTRKVAALEVPAHVALSVLAASHPLVVGLSSLVGIDSYLRPRPKPATARVDQSRLGASDWVAAPPSLDPRVEGDPS